LRLLVRILLRLLLPVVLGGIVLASQGRLPLAVPGATAGTEGQTVDPGAEADRVALTLRDLAARLKGGAVYDVDQPSSATTPPPPAPGFVSNGARAEERDGPRVLNGGGAGHFQRVPEPVR